MPGIVTDKRDPLDVLEAQIEELERKILGDAHFNTNDTPLGESLAHSNATLVEAVSSYSNIKAVFDKIDRLGYYLDPSYEEHLVSRNGRTRAILDAEQDVRFVLEHLNQLNRLDDKMSVEPLKNVPNLYTSLKLVAAALLKLEEDIKVIDASTKALLENFVSALNTVNRSILIFDALLTDMEETSKEVQADD